jgi:hypothetical protein
MKRAHNISYFQQMTKLPDKSKSRPTWHTFRPESFPYIPHDEAPPECAWALGATCEETQSNYKRAEAPFVPQIDEAIRTLCKTGSATTPSEAVAYFLGLRFIVLDYFFARFSIRNNPSSFLTIIPFPSLPPTRVLEWFLTDWWREWGVSEICFQRYSDEFHLGE